MFYLSVTRRGQWQDIQTAAKNLAKKGGYVKANGRNFFLLLFLRKKSNKKAARKRYTARFREQQRATVVQGRLSFGARVLIQVIFSAAQSFLYKIR
jgi:hypothetical protein